MFVRGYNGPSRESAISSSHTCGAEGCGGTRSCGSSRSGK